MYRLTALILLAVFYGCYFLKALLQYRKGIATDQMGKGKVGFVRFVELSLKTVTILVPVVELIYIIAGHHSSPVVFALGAALAGLGDAAFIASVVTMKDNWRAGIPETDKTELVVKGIYRWSRNPAFLGFDLLYTGVVLMFPGVTLVLVSLLGAVLFHLQIVNVEEDFLLAAFGDEYLEYRRHVCRYIGRK